MLKTTKISLIALTACMAVGCGSAPTKPSDRASASGSVTFAGSPLPAGTVGLQSADGVTKTSVSIRDGRFETDRAPIGDITVTVSTASVAVGNPAAYVAIPDRYMDPATSGLKATISEKVATGLNFALEK